MKRICVFLMLAGCGVGARTHVERAVEATVRLDALRAVTNFHVATKGDFMGMPYIYTTNGFMRIKLARGLEARHISSDVVHSYAEAKESLDQTPS